MRLDLRGTIITDEQRRIHDEEFPPEPEAREAAPWDEARWERDRGRFYRYTGPEPEPASETVERDVDELAEAAVEGGFTYNPVDKTSPIEGISVAPYQEWEKKIEFDQAPTVDDIYNALVEYQAEHADAWGQDRHYFGGWLDTDKATLYLDVSVVVDRLVDAYDLGFATDQLAGWDIAKGEEVTMLGDRTDLLPVPREGGVVVASAHGADPHRSREAAEGHGPAEDGRGAPRGRDQGRAGQGRAGRRLTRVAAARRKKADSQKRISDARALVVRIADLRRDAVRQLQAGAEVALAEALRLAGVRAVTKARNRQGRAAAQTVASAYERHDSLQPFFAALGVTEADLLNGAFVSYEEQARKWMADYRRRQRAASRDLGFDPDAVMPDESDRDAAAVAFIVGALIALARSRIVAGADPMLRGSPDSASGIIPPQIIIRAMKIADGIAVPRFGMSPDVLPELVAEISADGIVERIARELRDMLLDDLRGELRLRVDTPTDVEVPEGLDVASLVDAIDGIEAGTRPLTEYRWVHAFYGEPKDPFDPHAALDGIITTDPENDPAFYNDAEWPENRIFYPGDHLGCTCELVAQVPAAVDSLIDVYG